MITPSTPVPAMPFPPVGPALPASSSGSAPPCCAWSSPAVVATTALTLVSRLPSYVSMLARLPTCSPVLVSYTRIAASE